MAYDLVSSVNATAGNVASIEFTNIPQSGKDITLLASLRVTDGNEAGFVNVNNVTTDILPLMFIYGNSGSRITSTYDNSGYFFLWWNDSSRTSNVFGNTQLTFHDYTKSTATKNFSYEFVTENNGATYLGLAGGYFESNNAITSVKFTPQSSANFLQYSMVSLYIIS